MANYILTGTPGSGKTTLLHKLKALQYAVVEESATDVIGQEQQNGISRPWENIIFIEKITKLQIERQLIANQSAIEDSMFFDRSPICTYALCTFLKYQPSQILLNEIKRIQDFNIYDKTVFFIENLGYVEQTLARRINYQSAILFEAIHRETYAEFGFNLVDIKKDTVDNRIKKLISHTV
jgi:predicted ATPase